MGNYSTVLNANVHRIVDKHNMNEKTFIPRKLEFSKFGSTIINFLF